MPEEQIARPSDRWTPGRRVVVVVLCTLAVPVTALALSLRQHREYSATASLLLGDPQLDQKLFDSVVAPTSDDPDREAATNLELLSLDAVAGRAARALGGGVTARSVRAAITVSSPDKSDVANVTATEPTPQGAAEVANAYAEEYIRFRRAADRDKIRQAQSLVAGEVARLGAAARNSPQGQSLVNRLEQLRVLAALQTGNAELVQRATAPTAPSSPKPLRNALVGAVLGLALGLALASIVERFDRRLESTDEIVRAFDRPLLGAVPASDAIAAARGSLAALPATEAESFRMLRANLSYFDHTRAVVSVLITSATEGEGKSTVALQLARAAAGAGRKVLLLEADLRRPTLATKLGICPDSGLSQVLSDELSVEAALKTVPLTIEADGAASRSLDVLLAGPPAPNPAALVDSARMRALIRRFESDYDLVVLDTPPTGVVSDAVPLVKIVTGVLVVSRVGSTTRDTAAALRLQLENLRAHVLGVVVNGAPAVNGYEDAYSAPDRSTEIPAGVIENGEPDAITADQTPQPSSASGA